MNLNAISNTFNPSLWAQASQRQNSADPASIASQQESQNTNKVKPASSCETCKNRKYQDGSNDPGVSFKTPTKLSPSQAASAVRGHEQEHVSNERGKALREDREVISQSVVYSTAICPECGTSYVSGGTTRTTTQAKQAEKFQVGVESGQNGQYLDKAA